METARLPKPSQALMFVVLWRNYGTYRVCAYRTFAEAYKVFDFLKALARVAQPIDTYFEVYILYWFTGFRYAD